MVLPYYYCIRPFLSHSEPTCNRWSGVHTPLGVWSGRAFSGHKRRALATDTCTIAVTGTIPHTATLPNLICVCQTLPQTLSRKHYSSARVNALEQVWNRIVASIDIYLPLCCSLSLSGGTIWPVWLVSTVSRLPSSPTKIESTSNRL